MLPVDARLRLTGCIGPADTNNNTQSPSASRSTSTSPSSTTSQQQQSRSPQANQKDPKFRYVSNLAINIKANPWRIGRNKVIFDTSRISSNRALPTHSGSTNNNNDGHQGNPLVNLPLDQHPGLILQNPCISLIHCTLTVQRLGERESLAMVYRLLVHEQQQRYMRQLSRSFRHWVVGKRRAAAAATATVPPVVVIEGAAPPAPPPFNNNNNNNHHSLLVSTNTTQSSTTQAHPHRLGGQKNDNHNILCLSSSQQLTSLRTAESNDSNHQPQPNTVMTEQQQEELFQQELQTFFSLNPEARTIRAKIDLTVDETFIDIVAKEYENVVLLQMNSPQRHQQQQQQQQQGSNRRSGSNNNNHHHDNNHTNINNLTQNHVASLRLDYALLLQAVRNLTAAAGYFDAELLDPRRYAPSLPAHVARLHDSSTNGVTVDGASVGRDQVRDVFDGSVIGLVVPVKKHHNHYSLEAVFDCPEIFPPKLIKIPAVKQNSGNNVENKIAKNENASIHNNNNAEADKTNEIAKSDASLSSTTSGVSNFAKHDHDVDDEVVPGTDDDDDDCDDHNNNTSNHTSHGTDSNHEDRARSPQAQQPAAPVVRINEDGEIIDIVDDDDDDKNETDVVTPHQQQQDDDDRSPASFPQNEDDDAEGNVSNDKQIEFENENQDDVPPAAQNLTQEPENNIRNCEDEEKNTNNNDDNNQQEQELCCNEEDHDNDDDLETKTVDDCCIIENGENEIRQHEPQEDAAEENNNKTTSQSPKEVIEIGSSSSDDATSSVCAAASSSSCQILEQDKCEPTSESRKDQIEVANKNKTSHDAPQHTPATHEADDNDNIPSSCSSGNSSSHNNSRNQPQQHQKSGDHFLSPAVSPSFLVPSKINNHNNSHQQIHKNSNSSEMSSPIHFNTTTTTNNNNAENNVTKNKLVVTASDGQAFLALSKNNSKNNNNNEATIVCSKTNEDAAVTITNSKTEINNNSAKHIIAGKDEAPQLSAITLRVQAEKREMLQELAQKEKSENNNHHNSSSHSSNQLNSSSVHPSSTSASNNTASPPGEHFKNKPVDDDYAVDRTKYIGKGSFAVVYRATSRAAPQTHVAIKEIDKIKIRTEPTKQNISPQKNITTTNNNNNNNTNTNRHQDAPAPAGVAATAAGREYTAEELRRERQRQEREIEILRHANHPNVMRCVAIYETEEKLWFVLEYAQGGNLLNLMAQFQGLIRNEYINKKQLQLQQQQQQQQQFLPPSVRNMKINNNNVTGIPSAELFAGDFEYCMPESFVAEVCRQVCRALEYLHLRGIVHRDIKLENLLLLNKMTFVDISAVDFLKKNNHNDQQQQQNQNPLDILFDSPYLPHNIRIMGKLHIVVSDFGLSRILKASSSSTTSSDTSSCGNKFNQFKTENVRRHPRTGEVLHLSPILSLCGTPSYVAPEVIDSTKRRGNYCSLQTPVHEGPYTDEDCARMERQLRRNQEENERRLFAAANNNNNNINHHQGQNVDLMPGWARAGQKFASDAVRTEYFNRKQGYSPAVDVFSLGVCLFMLAQNKNPFPIITKEEQQRRDAEQQQPPRQHHDRLDYDHGIQYAAWFYQPGCRNVSEQCRVVLEGVLKLLPEERKLIADVLGSTWLAECSMSKRVEVMRQPKMMSSRQPQQQQQLQHSPQTLTTAVVILDAGRLYSSSNRSNNNNNNNNNNNGKNMNPNLNQRLQPLQNLVQQQQQQQRELAYRTVISAMSMDNNNNNNSRQKFAREVDATLHRMFSNNEGNNNNNVLDATTNADATRRFNTALQNSIIAGNKTQNKNNQDKLFFTNDHHNNPNPVVNNNNNSVVSATSSSSATRPWEESTAEHKRRLGGPLSPSSHITHGNNNSMRNNNNNNNNNTASMIITSTNKRLPQMNMPNNNNNNNNPGFNQVLQQNRFPFNNNNNNSNNINTTSFTEEQHRQRFSLTNQNQNSNAANSFGSALMMTAPSNNKINNAASILQNQLLQQQQQQQSSTSSSSAAPALSAHLDPTEVRKYYAGSTIKQQANVALNDFQRDELLARQRKRSQERQPEVYRQQPVFYNSTSLKQHVDQMNATTKQINGGSMAQQQNLPLRRDRNWELEEEK